VLLWTRLRTFGLRKGGNLNKCATHYNNENEVWDRHVLVILRSV
jgi:hypothetical protein